MCVRASANYSAHLGNEPALYTQVLRAIAYEQQGGSFVAHDLGQQTVTFSGAGSIPVHSFRAPAWVPGVDWSDHFSFRKLGMPGVLITDTAFLRYPHYHSALDTPEKLDYRRMAGLVRALHGLLAGEFLTGNAGAPPDETGQPETR